MVSKEFFGETKNVEFKREILNKHEKFLKDIIAFSNSTGGQVIVGIEDETCIVYGIGEQSPFKLSDSISNMISDACTPQIEPDISIQTIEDMTLEKLEDFGLLCKVGRDIYPTHAFDLLTDNHNKAAKIQCALFKGISRDIFIDQKEFTGPIQEQVEEAYQFVLRHINMGANIEGLFRTDIYELPITAIREMIANAVLHRSYLDRSCVQVCIFDDRIEVLSPGMLYGGLDIITAKHGKSTCRNEAIAEAFHYMKIVEAWGTGIPRIISRCKEYGLQEPIFEELGDGFLVTMFRKPTNQTNQSNQTNQLDESNPINVERRQDANVSDLENRIIELLKVLPDATTKEITKKLEITDNQVKYYIKKLKDNGKIERVGTNRKGTWKVM